MWAYATRRWKLVFEPHNRIRCNLIKTIYGGHFTLNTQDNYSKINDYPVGFKSIASCLIFRSCLFINILKIRQVLFIHTQRVGITLAITVSVVVNIYTIQLLSNRRMVCFKFHTVSVWLSRQRVRLSHGRSWVRLSAGSYQRPS